MQSLVARSVLRRLRPEDPFRVQVSLQRLSTGAPAGGDRDASGPTVQVHGEEFDESQLDVLVCPLSKSKLRWDPTNSELISDEIQVAYPVVNGIPHLTPEKARQLKSPMPGASPTETPPQAS